VDARIAACLETHSEAVGEAIGEYCGQKLAAMKGQVELLEREIAQLREQIAVERGLKALREQVDQARAEVPKVPALVEQLEAGEARLQRELKTTKDKLSRVRVDQSIARYEVSQLREQTAARATKIEATIETHASAFAVGEIHPDARTALRNFADEAVHDTEKIWVFLGPPVSTA
jgi:chromosome segregation ATPase